MPPNGQKQPRWLMGCKCGVTVKAEREGLLRSEAALEAPDSPVSSEPRCDGCALEGELGQIHDSQMTIAAALEQHPPLGGA